MTEAEIGIALVGIAAVIYVVYTVYYLYDLVTFIENRKRDDD